MFSSLMPPNTLNFFRLHTWVFSYFPKVMLWTIAGLSSFKIKYCEQRAEVEEEWVMQSRGYRQAPAIKQDSCGLFRAGPG